MRKLQGHSEGVSVRAVAFSPDGSRLASADPGGSAVLWDAATWELLYWSAMGPRRTHALAFSPEGDRLAAAGEEVVVWRVQERRLVVGDPPGLPYSHWTSGIAFHPKGSHLLIVDTHRDMAALGCYNLGNREMDREVVTDEDGASGPLALSAGGVLATGLRTVAVWRLPSLRTSEKAWKSAFADALRLPHRAQVRALAFSPDGRTLACAVSRVIHLWDAATGEKHEPLGAHAETVVSLDWHTSGLLASASQDGEVRFWDAASGRERRAFDWKIGKVSCVRFSPDGLRAAAGGARGRLVVWDVDV
jgi:WD40 repeat protein